MYVLRKRPYSSFAVVVIVNVITNIYPLIVSCSYLVEKIRIN